MTTSAGDSTLQEDPEVASARAPRAGTLRVIACPDAAEVGTSAAVSDDAPLLFGRKVERGGLALDDPKLSRVHARIVWDGRVGQFRIGDENSANGTAVDGERIGVATLRHGSVIRAGGSVLVFVEHDPVEELERRIALAAPTPRSVLLTGETGTGKELAARRLHGQSGRSGAFVPVNTAALPREILASELFGHVRGAFSGASGERVGLFRAAHAGTLFLDEIGDLAPELQPALLRALEERAVRPVGSEREVPVDVRVVAATHRDLRERVASGAFRLDLHARLAELELAVPALRDRRHTLPELIAELARVEGIDAIGVTADAMEAIALGRFEQNVRELKSLIGRLVVFGKAPFVLDVRFLSREAPALVRRQPPGTSPPPARAPASAITRDALEQTMRQHGDRVTDVAEALGTSRTQVYRWLERFGLSTPRGRK